MCHLKVKRFILILKLKTKTDWVSDGYGDDIAFWRIYNGSLMQGLVWFKLKVGSIKFKIKVHELSSLESKAQRLK